MTLSRQKYDQIVRQRMKDPLWVYAYNQAYFRKCEQLGIFPNRRRINTTDWQPIAAKFRKAKD